MKTIFIKNQEFVIRGNFCKIMQLKEEWDDDVLNPQDVIQEIKNKKISVDIFTFTQRLPELLPKYSYPFVYDNIAVLPISTFENWWNNQVFKQVRKNVRRSQRRGVIVKKVEFDDDLIKGIQNIYNETRIRQGRLNKHYGKTFEETKRVNITYVDRSDFIGAYLENELIGFIKLVYTKTNSFARTMGIEGKIKYRGLGYMHALIAKAVEICAEKNIPYMVYGNFVYGTKGPDSVTMFKIYNGFQKINVPRYYIVLSKKGRVLYNLGLYKEINQIIPGFILRPLLKLRKLILEGIYWRDFKIDKKAMRNSEKILYLF